MVLALAAGIAAPAAAQAAQVSREMRVAMSDGVTLQATLTGAAPLAARPVIVEFSPYGPGSGTTSDGSAYNYLLVQIRGTGDSDGQFDALGNQTQADVARTLQWACHQPWSNGNLGLNGFSASAITVYNSLHLRLPCVRTAVLKSGTYELYRDLLWPGGVSNFAPGLGVLALIGAPATAEGLNRINRNPISSLDTAIGLTDTGLNGGFVHPTLDSFWRERGFRGEAQRLPILMIDGFFDVESRGAFQAYQRLRGDGAHLLVIGAHDGSPAGTDGGTGATKAWFDRYLKSIPNGIERQPRVQLWMADGSRERYLAGKFVRYDAAGWPVPGTRWMSLALDPARSGAGHSINDGSLVATRPSASTTQTYEAIPTEPSTSDQPNTAIIGGFGINQAANTFPSLTETGLAEPQALTYTTAPLSADLLSAGPVALDLRLSSTAPESALWAVISDVWSDGTSHPMATGRLNSSYPKINESQSLKDSHGDIVQPYGDYSAKTSTPPATERSYQVEFWPIGNRFKKGDRVRLVILGASAASMPSTPAINSVRLGGPSGSRLLLPVLPQGTAVSVHPRPPHPRRSCPRATGRLHGLTLGLVSLGMTRARARSAFSHSSSHGRRYMDYFCLTPTGIRVGYGTPPTIAPTVSTKERTRLQGRVVLALTDNHHYTLRGVHPGTKLAAVAHELGTGAPFHIGINDWYLAPNGQSRAVLKVRHGTIQEIGIGDKHLTTSRQQAAKFLSSFS